MTSTTLQFLVAGALVVAWIWMLGRPLLTSLLRRSRRDSVHHFRSHQVALGRAASGEVGRWTGVPAHRHRFNPVTRWREQPLARRRLQTMLAAAIATFTSLLLAIALRGPFIRLFLLMTSCFVLYLVVAAYIGSRQLQAREDEHRRRLAELEDEFATPVEQARRTAGDLRIGFERPGFAGDELRPAAQVGDEVGGGVESRVGNEAEVGVAAGSDAVAEPLGEGFVPEEEFDFDDDGLFDEGFFEPIPELSPTGSRGARDRSIFDPTPQPSGGDRSGPGVDGDSGSDEADDRFAAPIVAADDGLIVRARTTARVEAPLAGAVATGEVDLPGGAADEVDGEVAAASTGPDASGDDRGGDLDDSEDAESRSGVTFTAPTVRRSRPGKRPKARPIYIEPVADAEDESARVVND